MSTVKKLSAVAMASAAAALILAGCTGTSGGSTASSGAAGAKVAQVHCSGVNSCKERRIAQRLPVPAKGKTVARVRAGYLPPKQRVMPKVAKSLVKQSFN